MKSRIIPIIRKEFIHILRDPRSLAIIFIMPTLMVMLFGYAITFDIKNINMAVLDQDNSRASRELIDQFSNSGYFTIVKYLNNREEIEENIMFRQFIAAIVIPNDYQESLDTGNPAQIQLLVDGSNANTATIVINYIRAAMSALTLNINANIIKMPINIEPRFLYNPDLKSSHFIVPGLLAVLMMMICAMLTSITIAREKETGTMEQIIVSPVKSREIIIGKVTPYIGVAFLVSSAVLIFSKVVFNVPIRGNILLLALFSLVFIYASLSIGVFISTKAKTQQVALMLSMVGTLLPSILLSGFMFPVFAMPLFLRIMSYIVPAKYFIVITRGIMLKGIGAEVLFPQALFLFVIGTILLFISSKNFKTNLES